MSAIRAAAFLAGCAAAGMFLGYLAALWLCVALSAASGAVPAVSAREASDLVGDIEGWLRTEGY
jgi:hypothetical protein